MFSFWAFLIVVHFFSLPRSFFSHRPDANLSPGKLVVREREREALGQIMARKEQRAVSYSNKEVSVLLWDTDTYTQ